MGQENNDEKKTLLQKLKRLMTVTESQAIEEEKQRQAKEKAEKEKVEKPVLKLIENSEVVKETVIENKKTAVKPQEQEKVENTHNLGAAADIIADVKKSYEDKGNKAPQSGEVEDISQKHKENGYMPNSDSNKAETLQNKQPEKTSTEKNKTVDNVKSSDNSAEERHEAANTEASNAIGDGDVDKQSIEHTVKNIKNQKKKVEQTKTNTAESYNQKQNTTKKKKTGFQAFLHKAVVFGQALNEKPDEYMSDDFYEDFDADEKTIDSKKIKSQKDKKAINKQSKKTVDNEEQAVKGESLKKIVEENKLVTKQHEEDVKEKIDDKLSGTADMPKNKRQQTINDDKPKRRVQKPEGNIVIDGDSIPMYAHEEKSPRINIEIGKLSPILVKEYEAYMEPEELAQKREQEQVKDPVEVITKATTSFNALVAEDESVNHAAYGLNKEDEQNKESLNLEDKQRTSKAKKKPSFTEEENNEKKKVKQERKNKKSQEEKVPLSERLFSSYKENADYSVFNNSNADETETIDDYESAGDAKVVRAEINLSIRRLFFRSLIVGIIFVLDLVVCVLQRAMPDVLSAAIPNVDIMFCIINFLLLIIAAAVCSVTIKNGLSPIWSFRGNSDTAIAMATFAVGLQCLISLFNSREFFLGGQNLYTVLVLFGLLLNSIGKLWIVLRIKENFRFLTADKRMYVAKIFNDEKVAKEMVDGTNTDDAIIAFQRRTKFLKYFLRLSYSPDPSEKTASKFAPLCIGFAVVVAIINGIVYQSVPGAISSFAAVACVGVPVCSLLAVNIPMRLLCKNSLKSDAMIVGYPAVKQFCDTTSVMVDSRELYPRTSIELVSVKPFISYDLEQAVINAAAVMQVANTSMTYVFEDIIKGKSEKLPIVESVKFEERKGIVGWVGGERVLIGNRNLLEKYGVELPSLDFEETYVMEDKQVTYLANAGQLIAMFITAYTADTRIRKAVQALDQNGVCILIRTADSNITAESIARNFGVHESCIKILPNKLGNICKDELSLKEEESRAYISTRGKLTSFVKALTGCIKIKSNIYLANVVQGIAVVLGLLIAATVAILEGVDTLGSIELLIYMIFWAIASIFVPLIQRPWK